jgi:replicative DNA helicase
VILKQLFTNEEYARKVLPFIKSEYFQSSVDRVLFDSYRTLVAKYNTLPTREAISLEIENASISQETHKKLLETIPVLFEGDKPQENQQWMLDQTEKFCQDRAIYNAITKSIDIIQGGKNSQNETKESLPDILKQALSVSFDSNIGHDFFENFEDRYEFYHRKEEKIPFDLEYMNKITNGGVPRKTLNIIMGGTNVGKSLVLCHMSAANLIAGKNVLYITLEMAEEKIAERIDANLMNTMLEDLRSLPKDAYDSKINRLKRKTLGRLIIKEFPTATAHVGHFRHLLNELHLKKNFTPDIIYIDYLNICASSRMKQGGSVNSYTYVKAIAEELRGLAVEKNVPVFSATQTNRTGYVSSDVGLEDVSESFGLAATADFMIAIITSEELAQLNQYMVKQLKNRYADVNTNRKFVIGVDRSRMKLYDTEQSAQENIYQESSVMDNTSFGERDNEERTMKWTTKKIGRKDFSGLKTS